MGKIRQKKMTAQKACKDEVSEAQHEAMMAELWKRLEGRIKFEIPKLNSPPPVPAPKWQRRIRIC